MSKEKKIDLPQLYGAMQKEMLQKLNTGVVPLLHPGTRGDNTEANWIDWFRAYLPERYKVDKAIIIDSTGRESDQIDLVIYDAQYSYLVFRQGDTKLIPAESVYAIFEVKQDLTKEHIEYAGKKARSVRTLERTSAPIKHAGGEHDPKDLHEILAGILTTRSGWTAQIEKHVANYALGLAHEEHLDFVCSISDSTFVIDHNTFVKEYDPQKKPVMRFCGADESLVFLLLNVLRRLQYIGTVPAIDFSKYEEKILSATY